MVTFKGLKRLFLLSSGTITKGIHSNGSTSTMMEAVEKKLVFCQGSMFPIEDSSSNWTSDSIVGVVGVVGVVGALEGS